MQEDLETARNLDGLDPLRSFRSYFAIPSNNAIRATCKPNQGDEPCTYFCGNSLGPKPTKSKELVDSEMARWSNLAVEGHFTPKGQGWVNQVDAVNQILGDLLGAKPAEIACMSTLTANLHLMMNAFYAPSGTRYKILCEAKAFPSDQYAFASQATKHGLAPEDAILELQPRKGEFTIREEDILRTIEEKGDTIALVIFSGLQYYTGQLFPIERITRAAQAKGCFCGWDLAHAVGNVPLSLHEWGVDFAVWCSYKYLNGGPGAIGGLFIHDKWDDKMQPHSAGWWGHKLETRFNMPPQFSPIKGAQGWQQSNPSVLAVASLQGSLEVFQEAGGMAPLRKKSLQMTAFLEKLLRKSSHCLSSEGSSAEKGFIIITTSNPEARGCQLSLLVVGGVMLAVFDGLKSRGVICDERKPDVIRLAPIPLYNTYEDCVRAASALDSAFQSL